jgi:chaperone modulatory protein CbpM
MSQPRRYPLARPVRLSLEGFASSAGLHPELVRRLVALGLLRAVRDGTGELWLAPSELVTVARIQRLRAGLSLNYAAVGLVCDLLDRIDLLERALRARPSQPARRDDQPWTSTA